MIFIRCCITKRIFSFHSHALKLLPENLTKNLIPGLFCLYFWKLIPVLYSTIYDARYHQMKYASVGSRRSSLIIKVSIL